MQQPSTELTVLTGVTSGFGAAALDRIIEGNNGTICIGARSPDTLAQLPVTALPLDLESMASVNAFCAALPEGPIVTVVLNAGINTPKLIQTADGIDRTFQVNYLSHFVMLQLIAHRLSPNARILLTGSGTHDPTEKTSTPPPKHADALRLADPMSDPERDRFGSQAAARAYTASKLCCILLARHWAHLNPAHSVVAFDPGFVPETGLTREYPRLLVALIKRIVSARMPADRTGSVETSANAFAALTLREIFDPASGTYVAMRGGVAVEVAPSAFAQDPIVAKQLWTDSMTLSKPFF